MKSPTKYVIATCFVLFAACSSKPQRPNEGNADIRVLNMMHDARDKDSLSGICYGIDISKYQGNELDVLEKKKDSLSFVICKATEGETYTDPDFDENWKAIAQKGFIRGAYHFYRSNDAPEDQVKLFLNAISDLKETDLPPIVDFEEASIDHSQSITKHQSGLISFLQQVESKTKRKPIIYTNLHIGNSYLNDTAFSVYPLWIAYYSHKTKPEMPLAWKDANWLIWQKSGSYKYENFNNDFDVFNGSLRELEEFISNH